MEVFKIVHLIKSNEVKPVSDKWENDGIVYWPKLKLKRSVVKSNRMSAANLTKILG